VNGGGGKVKVWKVVERKIDGAGELLFLFAEE